MKKIIYIIIVIIFYGSCSNEASRNVEHSIKKKVLRIELPDEDNWIDLDSSFCEQNFDTITDPKYRMHLGILRKYKSKGKRRGYYFSSKGDTINNFLYHQDISTFVESLNSKEKDIYRILTNKIVFLMLEKEPKMLDYGLTQWIREDEGLEYFMEHISKPICNTISIEEIISIIKEEMGEPHERAKEVKKMILEKLEHNIN